MYGKNNQISIVGYQKTEKRKMKVGPTKKETLITLIVHAYLDQVLYKDFVWNILFTGLHWLMFRSVICFHYYYYATLWPLLSHSFPHITVKPKCIFITYIHKKLIAEVDHFDRRFNMNRYLKIIWNLIVDVCYLSKV